MFTVNQEKYFDFGLTFGAEKLEELDEIKIHHETLHRLLIKKGLRDKGYSEEDLLYLTRHDSRESMGTYLNHLSKNMEEKQKEAYHLIADVIT